MAIRHKLGLIFLGLSVLILSMFGVTAQNADGFVSNLPGRQARDLKSSHAA